mgnify:CR=1 FL=1
MSRPLNILNIGGHPKDLINYAGGTMAKHAAKGDRVCMLTPTTGLSLHTKAIDSFKDTGIQPDINALIEERREELISASNELGINDVRFLGYPDDISVVDKKIVNDIADVIGDIEPNIIITHWPNDSSPAHAVATQMTMLAIEAASSLRPGKPYAPTGGVTGDMAQIFYHAHPGRTNVIESLAIRIPTTIIDITSVINQKIRAMEKFKSQTHSENETRKVVQALDGNIHSLHARVAYAEMFIAHNPQVYEYLPISEYGRKLASRPREQIHQEMSEMLLDE